MLLLSDPILSEESDCPYISGRKWRFSYFFARDLTGEELEYVLSRGWRKFGYYYFRPACRNCRSCIPLRVRTGEFNLSRSQKRVLRRGEQIKTEFKELTYSDEIFELYRIHSLDRFNKEATPADFMNSFYARSCPAIQSEYYLEGKLIAAGFLDVSTVGLSSVYFVYDTGFMYYSPGTLSILREISYAKSLGLPYYYLGYYIEENRSMSYKNSFDVNEKMDWETGLWDTT